MENNIKFSFGDDKVAKAYDTVLVPSLFVPWALQLIKENKPWSDKTVLDLACGTGVVTKALVQQVAPNGNVFALDINSQMLELAKQNCKPWENHIEFIQGSCESLPISDATLDAVVCQQGFQFFPNKKMAASEIFRVLKPKGTAIISTWCPVSECEIFGIVCETLEIMNKKEISQMMRMPFDNLTQQGLRAPFEGLGFSSIKIAKQEKYLHLNSIDSALDIAYATPIGPKLKELSTVKQEEFKKLFLEKIRLLYKHNNHFGLMTTNILKAVK